MGKIVLLIVLGFVAYAFWRTTKAVSRKAAEQRSAPERNTAETDSSVVKMVQCTHCGLHVPLGDALEGRGRQIGRFYCSTEHAQKTTGFGQKD